MNDFHNTIQPLLLPGAKRFISIFCTSSKRMAENKGALTLLNSRTMPFCRILNHSIILLILYALTGCASINSKVYVPFEKGLVAIEKANETDVNRRGSETGYSAGGNCKEQAVAYNNAVSSSGIESCVTCGILVQYSQPLKHCWNEVKCPDDGKWKLIDASRYRIEFNDGWDVEQSPEYIPFIRFKGQVSVEDIRKEQNYFWKSDKSLSYLIENCESQWFPIISEWRLIF